MIEPLPPVVQVGLIGALTQRPPAAAASRPDTLAAAAEARRIVMAIQRGLGYEPIDRETGKLGYDVESRVPHSGRLRFIEVKGRVAGADMLTVTRNEIPYSLNKPEDLILAMVEFHPDRPPCDPIPAPAFLPRAMFWRDQRRYQLCGADGQGGRA